MFPNGRRNTRLADINRPEGQRRPSRGQPEQDFVYDDRYQGHGEVIVYDEVPEFDRFQGHDDPSNRPNTRLADTNRPREYPLSRPLFEQHEFLRPGRSRGLGETMAQFEQPPLSLDRYQSREPLPNTHALRMRAYDELMLVSRQASDPLSRRHEYGIPQTPLQPAQLGAMPGARPPLGAPSHHTLTPRYQQMTQPSFSSMNTDLDRLRMEDVQDLRAERAERTARLREMEMEQRLRRQEHAQRRMSEGIPAMEMQQNPRVTMLSGNSTAGFQLSPQQRQQLQAETMARNAYGRNRNMHVGMVPAHNSEGALFRYGISSRGQLEAAKSYFRSRAYEARHTRGLELDNIPMSYWEDDASLAPEERRNKAEFIRMQQEIMDLAERVGLAASTTECATCMEGNPRSEMANLECGHAYCRNCFTSKSNASLSLNLSLT
jgi:hypothetical protein